MNDLSNFLAEVMTRLRPEQVFEGSGFDHDWKKSGDKWRGKCPWHDSKSGTAFYVDSNQLTWRCPSCDVGGGPLQYLHQVRGGRNSPEGKEFIAIAKELADIAGLQFPDRQMSPEDKIQAERLEKRRDMLECVIEHCHRYLIEKSTKAIAYLKGEKRRLTQEDIENRDIRLGIFPSADIIARHLSSRGYSLKDAIEYGILRENWKQPGGYTSEMEGYITVEWPDSNNRPLTIYGRWHEELPPEGRPKTTALPNPSEGGKDWLRTKNSPFCLNLALAARHRHLVVVEGIFDAFTVQRRGDSRAIAWVAAHPSGDQIQTLIKHKVESITFCLDPDHGGEKGISDGIKKLTEAGITTYVAPTLPEGKDPDEFINAYGLDAWNENINQKVHGFRYKAREIVKLCQPLTDQSIADAIVLADKFVEIVPKALQRMLQPYFWKEFESLTGVGASSKKKGEALDFDTTLDKVDELEGAIENDNELFWETQNFAVDAGLASRGFNASKLLGMARARRDNSEEIKIVDSQDILGKKHRPDWLINGVALRGVVAMVAANGGAGKTTLAYNWAKHMSTGESWNGYRVQKGRCLIVQADEPETNIQQKLQIAKYHHVPRGSVGFITKWRFSQLRQLKRAIINGGYDYVVIDSWTIAHEGLGVDLDKSAENAYRLRDIAEDTNCHIQIIHHLNNDGGYRNSGMLYNGVSEASRLIPANDQNKLPKGQVLWQIDKSRSGLEGKYILSQNIHDYSWQHLGSFEDPDAPGGESTIGRVLDLVESTRKPVATKDIAVALDIDYGKAEIELKRLVRQGLVNAEWRTFNTGVDDKQSGFWLYSADQYKPCEPVRVATGTYEEDF